MQQNSPEEKMTAATTRGEQLDVSLISHMAAVIAAGALDHALDPQKAARVGLEVAMEIHRQSLDIVNARNAPRDLPGGELEGGAAIPQAAG
jgi:hypothetical protein